MKRITKCGLIARHGRGAASFRNPKSATRNALTLIELMVVIVILMTLVGGVIPVLSPNNDARKIREASRGLQTYILQAQARAARTGRPAGIAFRETSPGSGIALEVFQIEVPPPFAGFSSSASAIFNRVSPPGKLPQVYEIHLAEGYGQSIQGGPNRPQIPEKLTQVHDVIEVGNAQFRLDRTGAKGNPKRDWIEGDDGVQYFQETSVYARAVLIAGSAPPVFSTDFALPASSGIKSIKDLDPTSVPEWSHPKRYRILRQPQNTSESPYTLPAGVAIDMHGSGTEGGATPTVFTRPIGAAPRQFRKDIENTIKQIGIMFSPNGSIEGIHYGNGWIFGGSATGERVLTPITDASRVFMLLGRVENVLREEDIDPIQGQSKVAMNNQTSDEQLAEFQERVNWLNLDSRWIVCDARSGRSVATENAFYDARKYELQQTDDFNPNIARTWHHLTEARKFAKQMKRDSGR